MKIVYNCALITKKREIFITNHYLKHSILINYHSKRKFIFAHIFFFFFAEYDGSPRRFGMTSNDDIDYYSIKYTAPLSSPPPPAPVSSNGMINYSPPRPGFPQRIVNVSSTSPAQIIPKSSYSFDEQQQQQSLSVTTTSTLIPTTFINNSSAYEMVMPSHETTIEEEPEILVDPHDDDDECIRPDELTVQEITAECMEQEIPQLQNEITTASCLASITSPTENLPTSTFDYLYEFSETRKVLEEFFKCPDDKIKEFEKFSDFNESDDSLVSFPYSLLVFHFV